MPQIQLPLFPPGVNAITRELGFEKRDGFVTYFNGQVPVFRHAEEDVKTFRMITSQFVVLGSATQAQISAAFGVPLLSVKRGVKKYRVGGVASFFKAKQTRGASVLTSELLAEIQTRLDSGDELGDIAKDKGLKTNTLNKAVHAGRLHRVGIQKKKTRHRINPPRQHS